MSDKQNNPIDKLQARVDGFNKVGELAMTFQKSLREAFVPFIGKKILKADNGLTAEILKAYNTTIAQKPKNFRIWREVHSYAPLCFSCDLCVPISEHTCTYCKVCFAIGEVKNGILVSLNRLQVFHTNYNADEIRTARLKIEQLDTEKRDLEYSIANFGAHDNV